MPNIVIMMTSNLHWYNFRRHRLISDSEDHDWEAVLSVRDNSQIHKYIYWSTTRRWPCPIQADGTFFKTLHHETCVYGKGNPECLDKVEEPPDQV